MQDHGGNIDAARALFGGADWIDLSTGINRVPYPVPPLDPGAWAMLPTQAAKSALLDAASAAYQTTAPILATAGAQAAIQMIPRLQSPGRARVLGPTYNEHAAALRFAGWEVAEVANTHDLIGADLAIVVNPNNPTGRSLAPAELLALVGRVGRLVVDESFADAQPHLSLAPEAGQPGLLILRSFGKFYGLAGLRLGFVLGPQADIATLEAMSGPWPVTGPALAIGAAALLDTAWGVATAARLRAEVTRIDTLARNMGWQTVGGTELFRLYDTPDAAKAQNHLAHQQIWSRRFPYSTRWLRLGLPGGEAEWARLATALTGAT